MIATLVNCITVILGSLLGILIRSRITKEFQGIVENSAALTTLVMGIGMALKTNSYIILLFSLILGGIIGSFFKIQDRIYHLGENLDNKKGKTNSSEKSSEFATGFLNASVLFCAGAMSILGAIQAGADHNYDLLFLKSILDGSMAIVLSATYGVGVMASALVILVFQGSITLLSTTLSPLLGAEGITELSAIGGVMIIMIAFNLLHLKPFKTANYIPSLILAPIFITWQPYFIDFFNQIL